MPDPGAVAFIFVVALLFAVGMNGVYAGWKARKDRREKWLRKARGE